MVIYLYLYITPLYVAKIVKKNKQQTIIDIFLFSRDDFYSSANKPKTESITCDTLGLYNYIIGIVAVYGYACLLTLSKNDLLTMTLTSR